MNNELSEMEQKYEITSSFNNNNIKHNFNDYEEKKMFYNSFSQNECITDERIKQIDTYLMQRNEYYKTKMPIDDSSTMNHHNANLSTPFLVKDILNINQQPSTYHQGYERVDAWPKHSEDGDKKTRDHETNIYHSQAYGPTDYYSQVYPNPLPVYSAIGETFWSHEAYHEGKTDEYYENYNNYCHNFYQQNYENHYSSLQTQPIDVSPNPQCDVVNREMLNVPPEPALIVQEKINPDQHSIQHLSSLCPPYQITSPIIKHASRKINSM